MRVMICALQDFYFVKVEKKLKKNAPSKIWSKFDYVHYITYVFAVIMRK